MPLDAITQLKYIAILSLYQFLIKSMQTITFTQKLLRQRSFLSSLIPLLALFLGLDSVKTVSAQSYNFDDITISSNPTGGTSTVTTYDGTLDPNGNNPAFDAADLGNGGIFNLSTGSLTITAASTNLQTKVPRPITFSNLTYRVYLTNTVNALPSFSSLSLTQTSASNTGDPVTFAASDDDKASVNADLTPSTKRSLI